MTSNQAIKLTVKNAAPIGSLLFAGSKFGR
jgi:hypothetical protein